MKGRQILLDRAGAALMVDGRLEDLLLDQDGGDQTPIPGTIYCARVERLVPKQGAAFVRLDDGQTGYLREAKGRREGERLLVQVIAYAEPGKAAPVKSRLLYKTRCVIHTPDAPGINVSRQIKDPEERARLQALAEGAMAEFFAKNPEAADRLPSSGLILRSAAEGADSDEIQRQVQDLLATHLAVLDELATGWIGATTCMRFNDSMKLSLPEWTHPLPDQILSDPISWDALFQGLRPHPSDEIGYSKALLERMSESEGMALPFELFGVWEEIETLKSPRAELRSGGWLSVEATAALVSIDVNTSGQFGGGDALTANLEAAREIPRQLRLRGLGGIVVIDWAPLPKRDRKRVEDALKAALKRDPVETTVAGWTPLGLMELTRKRERRPLSELLG